MSGKVSILNILLLFQISRIDRDDISRRTMSQVDLKRRICKHPRGPACARYLSSGRTEASSGVAHV